MHIIIMPPQHIMHGMPASIIVIIALQQVSNISFDIPAIGIILHVIVPSAPISQVIRHIIIGIMPPMGMPIIEGIMPPMGMPIIEGIMPPMGMPIIEGIMPPMGIPIIEGIMPLVGVMPPIIGIIAALICLLLEFGNRSASLVTRHAYEIAPRGHHLNRKSRPTDRFPPLSWTAGQHNGAVRKHAIVCHVSSAGSP